MTHDHSMEGQHILQHVVDDLLVMENEKDIWDDPPELIVVLNPEPGEDKYRVGCPLPEGFWYDKNPATALVALSLGVLLPNSPVPFRPEVETDKLVGIILRTEGWGFHAESSAPEKIKEYEKWVADGNRIVDHIDARETKQYSAAGVDGVWFHRMQFRHEEPREWMVSQEGRIVDAMKMLLGAMMSNYGLIEEVSHG